MNKTQQNKENDDEKPNLKRSQSKDFTASSSAFSKADIPDNLEGMSAKELKNLLDKFGIKRDDCFEKEDLVNRLK